MTQQFFYGSFAIGDGVNYYLIQRSFDMPDFQQTLFKIARLEGEKLTGSRLNSKQIPVTIKVVGVSRADLEAKLDALYAALALRQQQLTLHVEDARYYIADAISARAPLGIGQVIAASVPVVFVAEQPFAYAPSLSSATTGNLTLSQVIGTTTNWQLPTANNPFVVNAGGSFFARPTIQITNQTAPNAATLTSALTNGTNYTSLSISSLPNNATSGQVFLLANGTNFQRVTLSANASAGATSLSVVSFNANANYPASTTFCGLDNYLQGFTLTENPDGKVLTVIEPGAQDIASGNYWTVYCDPTMSDGYTVIPISGARSISPLAFTGSFPVVQPSNTQFSLQVTCSNPPTVNLTVNWTARWLS